MPRPTKRFDLLWGRTLDSPEIEAERVKRFVERYESEWIQLEEETLP